MNPSDPHDYAMAPFKDMGIIGGDHGCEHYRVYTNVRILSRDISNCNIAKVKKKSIISHGSLMLILIAEVVISSCEFT